VRRNDRVRLVKMEADKPQPETAQSEAGSGTNG
jgi:NADH-quinone oxidoreductase subunit J